MAASHRPRRRPGTGGVRLDPSLPRWPTITIAVVAGGFVVVVSAAWLWSHVVRGEEVDGVAMIIAGATVARAASIVVSVEALRARGRAVRWLNVALAGFASAQLVYPVAEGAVKVLVLVGVVDEGPGGVRNMSAGGWFNFTAAALVFGVPGVMFSIQARQHAQRHGLGVGPRMLGAFGGIACLGIIGAAIGTG